MVVVSHSDDSMGSHGRYLIVAFAHWQLFIWIGNKRKIISGREQPASFKHICIQVLADIGRNVQEKRWSEKLNFLDH